jgi:16S rRNA G966 N2-methylase RsmD
MGIQAIGQIPHASDAGRESEVPVGKDALWTSSGRTAWRWLRQLADRLERVRVLHGDWSRCLNYHYGKTDTAIFFDPPYKAYEKLYGVSVPVAAAVEDWAREHPDLRIALCGHAGDYALPGWELMPWSRKSSTYGGSGTTAQEVVWFSPACDAAAARDIALDLFTP